MDFFDFDAMKLKNSSASSNSISLWLNHLIPSLAKLFRWTELCLAMVLLSWIFNRLPFVIRISGDFVRQISGVIVCPLFVFLLCNAIIVTLIVKSDRFSGAENPAADNAEAQLYEELLKNNNNNKISFSKPLSLPENNSSTPDPEIEFQDKEIIISQVNNDSAAAAVVEDDEDDDENVAVVMEKPVVSDSDSADSDCTPPRVYRRWKSEKLEWKDDGEMMKMKLRRSETVRFMKEATKSRDENGDVLCPGEDLSAEEFQRAVDDFIAKHLRFRRQESFSSDDVQTSSEPELNFQN